MLGFAALRVCELIARRSETVPGRALQGAGVHKIARVAGLRKRFWGSPQRRRARSGAVAVGAVIDSQTLSPTYGATALAFHAVDRWRSLSLQLFDEDTHPPHDVLVGGGGALPLESLCGWIRCLHHIWPAGVPNRCATGRHGHQPQDRNQGSANRVHCVPL